MYTNFASIRSAFNSTALTLGGLFLSALFVAPADAQEVSAVPAPSATAGTSVNFNLVGYEPLLARKS